MDTKVKREYFRLRRMGWLASCAMRAARVKAQFDDHPGVRIRVEADDDPSSALDFEADERTMKRERERAEHYGVWGIVGEYLDVMGKWQHADSCWGFIGDDWEDSGYNTDIMLTTLDAYEREHAGMVVNA